MSQLKLACDIRVPEELRGIEFSEALNILQESKALEYAKIYVLIVNNVRFTREYVVDLQNNSLCEVREKLSNNVLNSMTIGQLCCSAIAILSNRSTNSTDEELLNAYIVTLELLLSKYQESMELVLSITRSKIAQNLNRSQIQINCLFRIDDSNILQQFLRSLSAELSVVPPIDLPRVKIRTISKWLEQLGSALWKFRASILLPYTKQTLSKCAEIEDPAASITLLAICTVGLINLERQFCTKLLSGNALFTSIDLGIDCDTGLRCKTSKEIWNQVKSTCYKVQQSIPSNTISKRMEALWKVPPRRQPLNMPSYVQVSNAHSRWQLESDIPNQPYLLDISNQTEGDSITRKSGTTSFICSNTDSTIKNTIDSFVNRQAIPTTLTQLEKIRIVALSHCTERVNDLNACDALMLLDTLGSDPRLLGADPVIIHIQIHVEKRLYKVLNTSTFTEDEKEILKSLINSIDIYFPTSRGILARQKILQL